MCGRYSLFTPPAELEDRFDVTFDVDWEPRYNLAPSQSLPVVTNHDPERVSLQTWGLVPEWADDGFSGLINARAETADEKPAFREAYQRRRCLVFADGFYEWVETEEGKQPHRVALEDDEPFAMAGLWERRVPEQQQTGLGDFGGSGPTGGPEPEETFTILTTEPNDLVGELHHRMAVILPKGREREWLERPDEELLTPYPSDRMRAYPVSTRVNSPANDDASLIEPV
ncbi:SOS response-associated peptidase [Natronomonas sp. EA1]|uniref:SOS response-associated peptidase n=1 Tax=Natronomonas sp. EA1 TaxID=3421655 RepID=UPI003EB8AD48